MWSSALVALALLGSVAADYVSHPIVPRKPAPSFTAPAVVGEEIVDFDLADWKDKWKVLFFYPLDFTFVCPTEIVAFSEASAKFKAIGAEVAAISTDSKFTHLAWVRTPREDGGVGKLDIPLIADFSKEISKSYGVLVDDPNDDMFGAPLRGLYIVDPKGIVRSVQINDEAVGRNVDETLRILQGFQYADAHAGEGCPANWQPGDATIKANPFESKTFFSEWGNK